MSKPIPFDVFTIKVYEDGYMLTVDKMRPANAPYTRQTAADRNRTRKVVAENGKLAEEGLQAPMQTLDEVVTRIRSYGGIR